MVVVAAFAEARAGPQAGAEHPANRCRWVDGHPATRTFRYRTLPTRKTLRLAFPGRAGIGATGKVARTRPRLRTRTETFGAPVLRVSLGIIFLWFGALKFFPGLSPAQDLAARTIEQLSFGIVQPSR
jgi:hypothetical protein